MIAARATTIFVGLALAAAVAGCGGGGHAAPDGGDGHIDVDAGSDADATPAGPGIIVDTPSGMVATETMDGYCDILEAAAAAASGRSVRECRNADGGARIVLAAGNTYPLRKTLRLSGATEVGLADGATGAATITAAPDFVVDAGNPVTSCLVAVSDTKAQVSLHDVTLSQDSSLTLSGACVWLGRLNVRRAHVTQFRAGGLVANCLPTAGCDHEADVDQSSTLRLLGSLVDENRNAGKGGGVSSEGSGATVLIAHSAIVNNASDNDGGGVYLGGGWNTQIIQSSTISGNTTSGSGGGVLARFAEMTNTYLNVLTSTIADNTASGTGGGIEFEPAQAGVQDVSVFSSIVAGNYAASSTLEWNINAGWSPTGLFNCVNGSFIYVTPGNPRPTDMGGCTFDVRNPFLGPLLPMGGEGNLPLHPLLMGSPAVDAALDEITIDQQRNAWIDNIDPGTPADWTIFDPLVDGDGDGTAARDLGPYERTDRWQTELLAVQAKGPSAHAVVTLPAGYDRGAGTTYSAASVKNESVTYALPIAEAGRYDVTVGVRKDADGGTFQIAIANNPAGPWTNLGLEQDGYAATAAFVPLGPFATPTFVAPDQRLVRFSVTGKNAASTGYHLSLDYIQVTKRSNACPITDIAAGGDHTCALMASGGVRCWGADSSGQLGDNGTTNRVSPPATDVVTAVRAIAPGGSHTCVLSTEGVVRCWGLNVNGQVGAPLSGVKAIAAGALHTCALMMTGGVRCWGANRSGQLGDGSTSDRAQPPTTDVLTGVKAIAAGGAHTCALMDGGGVRCWGANGSGQLGDGTMTDRSSPPTSDAGGGFAAIVAGDTHTCGLTTAGGVRCWGHNADNELGTAVPYDTVLSPPATDAMTGVTQIAAGNLFTCALTTAGGVRCWGYNSHGEIGDDTEIAVDRPRLPTTDILTGVASITAGLTHACARMTSGGFRCWGGNDFGQLGDGMAPIFALTPPTLDTPGFRGTCE